MFRPLTPAFAVAAVLILAACSDGPFAPRFPSGLGATESPAAGVPGGNPNAPGSSSGGGTDSEPVSEPNPDSAPAGGDEAGNDDAGAGDSSPNAGSGETPADDSSTGNDSGDNGAGDTPAGGSAPSSGADASNSDGGSSSDSSSTSSPDENQNTGSQSAPAQGSSSGSGASGSSSTSQPGSQGGQSGNGVSSAITLLGGTQVEVAGGEIVGYRSAPVPAAAGGICGDGENGYALGTWVKTTPGATSVHADHHHCVVRSETATITISFDLAGTYVVAPSGNLNLNLAPLCTNGSCAERNVHYRVNQNVTTGQGILFGQGSDGSVWSIDLSQIQHAGHTRPAVPDGINPLHRSYTALTATRQGGAPMSAQVTLAW